MAGLIERTRFLFSSSSAPDFSGSVKANPQYANVLSRRRFLSLVGVGGAGAVLGLTTGCEILPENTEQEKLKDNFSDFQKGLRYSLYPAAYESVLDKINLLHINPEFLPYRFTYEPMAQERQELYGLSLQPIDYTNPETKAIQPPDLLLWIMKNTEGQPVQIILNGCFGEDKKITTKKTKRYKNYTYTELSDISGQLGKPLVTSEKSEPELVGGLIGPGSGIKITLENADMITSTEVLRSGDFSITIDSKGPPLQIL